MILSYTNQFVPGNFRKPWYDMKTAIFKVSGLEATTNYVNIGMYLSGIPAGILVDSKGPKLAIIIGAVALFCGYYPIYLGMV